MILVATQNFRTADRILEAPPPVFQAAGETAHALMRHQAAESNRALFRIWGLAQIGIGVTVFLLLLFGSTAGKTSIALSAAMLLLTLVLTFYVLPEMSVPGTVRFRMLHGVYSSLELVKIVLGAVLAVLYLWGRERLSRSRHVNPIDYADHRHVNR